jgi:hypothetical protein
MLETFSREERRKSTNLNQSNQNFQPTLQHLPIPTVVAVCERLRKVSLSFIYMIQHIQSPPSPSPVYPSTMKRYGVAGGYMEDCCLRDLAIFLVSLSKESSLLIALRTCPLCFSIVMSSRVGPPSSVAMFWTPPAAITAMRIPVLLSEPIIR